MPRQESRPEVTSALPPLGWKGRLNDAMTLEDVVATARDYMALWGPDELSEVPPDLRPGKIVDADDVTNFALALIQAQMGRGTGAEPHLRKMGVFFSDASLRIAQIMAHAGEVPSELGESASRYGR
jgi:hypothetical protein